MKTLKSLVNIGGIQQIMDTYERQRNEIGESSKKVVIQLGKS